MAKRKKHWFERLIEYRKPALPKRRHPKSDQRQLPLFPSETHFEKPREKGDGATTGKPSVPAEPQKPTP